MGGVSCKRRNDANVGMLMMAETETGECIFCLGCDDDLRIGKKIIFLIFCLFQNMAQAMLCSRQLI